MLGGVHVPSRLGLVGHSDADVLLHALTDALLGSLVLPDIGALFPDTDPRWKNAPSGPLLAKVYGMVKAQGYELVNADCTLVCDKPRLQPYHATIRNGVAGILNVSPGCIGLKAKTTEGTQLALKHKSIAALVVVLVGRESGVRASDLDARRSGLR
jgi:2-C-methyl-D-erythritol 2,4-cyclodiphosphate synthase